MIVPQRFYVTQQSTMGARHLYGSLTRFIPPDVAALFERCGPSAEAGSLPPAAALPPVDLGARVRGLF